jgi:GNAT superfamily N-acetyltransferase
MEVDKQMPEILKDLSPSALIMAIEANQFDLWRILAQMLQTELHHEPDMIWFSTDIPFYLCNLVGRAQFQHNDIDARIDTTLTRFKSRGRPMSWWTGPVTRPTNLGEYLEAHGLTHVEDYPGMAVDLLTLNVDLSGSPGLTIERVEDIEGLEKWIHPFTIGIGYPDYFAKIIFDSTAALSFDLHLPMHHYVGLLKGEPVACLTLILGSGVAGIYNVATVPEARRQGIGTVMTLMSLREARTLGYRVAILQSSQVGLGVYHRLGFKEYCKIGMYMWTGETNE